MTADEIRNLKLQPASSPAEDTVAIQLWDCAQMLKEIAAQLAEINDSIASIQCAVNCDGSLNVNVKVQQ